MRALDSGTEHTPTTLDTRVVGFQPLPTPVSLRTAMPLEPASAATIDRGRHEVAEVLSGADDRLLVIVGPCSIHDPDAALDYAHRLQELSSELAGDLVVVMRAYFEKPRSTVGWKGLVNDPHLDGSHDVAAGLQMARRFLLDLAELDLPAATELLEPITPQYLADLISWAAIGARTSESQIHRQLASGLSMPVGFKNSTDGEVGTAVSGASSSRLPQTFLGVDETGRAALVSTTGNTDTHIVLRGGRSGPNYAADHVAAAAAAAARAGLGPGVVVDASHTNSGKDHHRQAEVVRELAAQVASDGRDIAGVMMESFLVGGAQTLPAPSGRRLVYGQSVTDACLSWETTATLLVELAGASASRRRRQQAVVGAGGGR